MPIFRASSQILGLICILGAIPLAGAYAEGQGASVVLVKKDITKSRIPMFGRDFGQISRIVIDGIPEGGYVPKAGNRILNLEFTSLKGYLDPNDLPPQGSASRLLKADVRDGKKPDTTILSLTYNCDCQADVYVMQGKKLVIDIYSNNATLNPSKAQKVGSDFVNPDRAIVPSKEPLETSVNPNHVDTGGRSLGGKSQAFGQTGERQMGTGAGAFSQLETSAKNFSQTDGKTEKFDQKTSAGSTIIASDIDPAMRNQLVGLLRAAEDQGVQFDPSKPNTYEPPKKVTSIDLGQLGKPPAGPTSSPQDALFQQSLGGCLSDDLLTLGYQQSKPETLTDGAESQKRKPVDVMNEIAKLMSKISANPDHYDQEASLQLIQLYVSYGMGQEALQAIKAFGVPDQRGQVVQSLAHLFADEIPLADPLIMNGEKCKGLHGLWATYTYLKRGQVKKAAEIANTASFEDILDRLPKGLQEKVGVPLATAMVQNKNLVSADKLIDKVASLTDQFSPSVMLVRGMIDNQKGHSQKALDTLASTVGENGIENPDPRLMLLGLKMSYNQSLSRSDHVFLEELAFLRGQKKEGAEAIALIAEDLARKKDFQGAFNRLAEGDYEQDPSENPIYQKAENLFSRMAIAGEGNEDGSDMVVYWKHQKLIPHDPKVMKMFGKRLLDQGYSGPAVDIFSTMAKENPEFSKGASVAPLHAEALRQSGSKQTAVDVLAGYAQPEIRLQRAQIFAEMERYGEAIDVLKGLETPEAQKKRADYALLKKDWKQAVQDYKQVYNQDPNPQTTFRLNSVLYMGSHQNAVEMAPTSSGVVKNGLQSSTQKPLKDPVKPSVPVANLETLDLLLKETNDVIKTYKGEFNGG